MDVGANVSAFSADAYKFRPQWYTELKIPEVVMKRLALFVLALIFALFGCACSPDPAPDISVGTSPSAAPSNTHGSFSPTKFATSSIHLKPSQKTPNGMSFSRRKLATRHPLSTPTRGFSTGPETVLMTYLSALEIFIIRAITEKTPLRAHRTQTN